MATGSPSRTDQIYRDLLHRILSGDLPFGAKLPAHLELATHFGVAPMTVRTAIARLDRDGYVERVHGRGTFVRWGGPGTVLVVKTDPERRPALAAAIGEKGFRVLEAAHADEALQLLETDASIRLVITSMHIPTPDAGAAFLRRMHTGWPQVPLAAVVERPDDLATLHGTPEYPFLVLSSPVDVQHLQSLLSYTFGHPSPPGGTLENVPAGSENLAEDRLQRALAYARRQGQVLGLLVIDAGDAALEVTRLLTSVLRASDAITRVSHSTLSVLLLDIGSRKHALTVGRKILAALDRPDAFGSRGEVKIGIALYPFDGLDSETLTAAAERAMQEASAHPDHAVELYRPDAAAS